MIIEWLTNYSDDTWFICTQLAGQWNLNKWNSVIAEQQMPEQEVLLHQTIANEETFAKSSSRILKKKKKAIWKKNY